MASSRKTFGWLTNGALVVFGFAVVIRLGFEAWPAIQEWRTLQTLASELRSPNARVAWTAAGRLVSLGPRSSPIFLRALHDKRKETRLLACQNLRQVEADPNIIGQAFRETLCDSDAAVRAAALRYLGTFRTEDAGGLETHLCLQSLLGVLTDDEEGVRASAASALSGFCSVNKLEGERGQRIATALGSALNDPNFDVRAAAANGLGMLGSLANSQLPKLEATLDDPNLDVRAAAALALLRLVGLRHDAAVETLATILSETAYVPPGTGTILSAIHAAGAEADEQALAIFLAKLRSEKSFEGRAIAIGAIRDMGPNATSAIPTLLGLLEPLKTLAGSDVEAATADRSAMDRDLTLRCMVATAILPIANKPNPQAIAAILESIVDPSVYFMIRSEAVNAVQVVDPKTYENTILGFLCKSLGSDDQLVRFASHDLLKTLYPAIEIDLNALYDKPLSIEPKDLKP